MKADTSLQTGGAGQMVTASELVRHFGVWQDRAVRAPVYVVHRGRPRLVLTSVELMDALCAPHAVESGGLTAARLLDGVREGVVAVDQDARVTAVGTAARAILGGDLAAGTPLTQAWPSPHGFLPMAARRVLDTGMAETVEVPGPRAAHRRLSVLIEPMGEGALLLLRDVTAEGGVQDLEAERDGTAMAIAAAGGATVTVSLRGQAEGPGTALARITGLDPEAVTAVRFASLFDVSTRVAVADAVEAVLRGEEPIRCDATLMARAGPLPVRLGLAPRIGGPAVDGVVAAILPR